MSGTRSLRTHLLTSALAAILLLSLTAQAMPLSWRTARHRRQTSSSDELPTQTGTLTGHATELHGRPAGGSHDSEENDGSNRSCSEGAPPEDMINQIKEDLLRRPHPMFFISEMAEMLHRREYYGKNFHCDNWQTKKVLNETIKEVKRIILHYLNNNRLPTDGAVACPPQYNITYYPNRYPRYLVQVVCTTSSAASNTGCSSPSCGANRECKPYQLDNLTYLEKDNNSEWIRRIATDVGVGCKCSE